MVHPAAGIALANDLFPELSSDNSGLLKQHEPVFSTTPGWSSNVRHPILDSIQYQPLEGPCETSACSVAISRAQRAVERVHEWIQDDQRARTSAVGLQEADRFAASTQLGSTDTDTEAHRAGRRSAGRGTGRSYGRWRRRQLERVRIEQDGREGHISVEQGAPAQDDVEQADDAGAGDCDEVRAEDVKAASETSACTVAISRAQRSVEQVRERIEDGQRALDERDDEVARWHADDCATGAGDEQAIEDHGP